MYKVNVEWEEDFQVFEIKARTLILDSIGDKHGQAICQEAEKIWHLPERKQFYEDTLKAIDDIILEGVDPDDTFEPPMYNKNCVDIEVFLTDKFFLPDADKSLFPVVKQCMIELNRGDYDEAVLVGGIGTAKTTIAVYTNLYQLYKLSCLTSPHRTFKLDPASEIVIVFQTLNKEKAKDIDYARFKSLVEKSPYFQQFFPHKTDIDSKLYFPHNIIVKPVSGKISGTIGENVIAGILDEVNFMEIIHDSKRSVDGQTYNQAEALYNSLARRRESRFMMAGNLPGILCIVSSKRYPGEFTDVKIDQAKNDPKIYVYSKTIWEVKPKGTFSDKNFYVYIGDETSNPYIIDEEAEFDPDDPKILAVPVDYKKQFEADILDALREIGNISLRSTNPFIPNAEAIAQCFKGKSCLNLNTVEFSTQKLMIIPNKIRFKHLPRFVHIDLGLTKDHAGIVMGYCPGFKTIDRGEGITEQLPKIVIDFALDIIPPKNGEIDIAKIRTLIYRFWELGVNVKWVSMDQFNSADMLQRFKAKGFKVGRRSVDAKPDPYLQVKAGLYDNRIEVPLHPVLRKELMNLELDVVKEKIDHPANGSKDISDALAGVVYGLSMQRETWLRYNQSISAMNMYARKYISKKEATKQKDMVGV